MATSPIEMVYGVSVTQPRISLTVTRSAEIRGRTIRQLGSPPAVNESLKPLS